MREAMLYEKLDRSRVRCHLCGHYCVVPDGKLGVCQVRQNIDGKLFSLVYGRTISQHVDPVEKKPLYHFLPGSSAYSIATPGCNFKCQWCQNSDIAHMPCEYIPGAGQNAPPSRVVENALASGSESIAYTYTEPTIFFEYAFDVAKIAHQAGIANIYVTNGYMTPEMLEIFHPYLDAANVDLKAFRNKTYNRYVGAGLQAVLDSLVLMKKLGVWVEVTTLVIPSLNDDPVELRDAAQFVSRELGPDTPWHLSRFFPTYQMRDRPPTPVRTLELGREIGRSEGLRYVYLGNVGGESNTYCPGCGKVLVSRSGYWVSTTNIQDGCCKFCKSPVAGVWEFPPSKS
jgi:pyruvate formate lyase activating enzyme